MSKKETAEHITVAKSFLEDLEALCRRYDVPSVNSTTGKKYTRQADIYIELPNHYEDDNDEDEIFIKIDLPCPDGTWVHVELPKERPFDELISEGGDTR